MNPNRLAEGYQPEFDIDAEVGRQGELFVLDLITAFKEGRGEVKTDAKAYQTRNVYVEFSCLYRGEYAPSGIAVTQSDVWAHAVGDPPAFAIVAPTALVRSLVDRAIREGSVRECIRGSHPTRGALIPLAKLLPWLIDEHRREAA